MRLGILSDTHDEIARTRLAVRLLRTEGVDALVHCGDVTGPDLVAVLADLPCYYSFGNHDADSVPYLQRAIADAGSICLGWGGVIELTGKRVGVVHGHMRIDVQRVLADRPDYLLSGHSHIASDHREGLVRRINPGALHEAQNYTVALLDLGTDELQFVTIPGGNAV
jgi:putative phosphoesterase